MSGRYTDTMTAPDHGLVVYHGTRTRLDTLDPGKTLDGGIHFGTIEQAQMRNSQWIYEARLNFDGGRVRRSRDRGGEWKKRIADAKASGFKAIVYLNRYEGIPYERVVQAQADGVDLDKLTDSQFRKRVPEAKDSWIVFDPASFTIVRVLEGKPARRPGP